MNGMSWFQAINYVVKWDTYGWDLLFPNNESPGQKGTPMKSCIQTINHVVTRACLQIINQMVKEAS